MENNRSIIQWDRHTETDIMFKYTQFGPQKLSYTDEIVVKQGEVAIFTSGGKLADSLEFGEHEVNNSSLPILSEIKIRNKQENLDANIYFIDINLSKGHIWGSSTPVGVKDKNIKNVSVGVIGKYDYQITNYKLFVRRIAPKFDTFSRTDLDKYIKPRILTEFINTVNELHVSIFEIDSYYMAIASIMEERLQEIFSELGITLKNIVVDEVHLPEFLKDAFNKDNYCELTSDSFRKTDFDPSLGLSTGRIHGIASVSDGLNLNNDNVIENNNYVDNKIIEMTFNTNTSDDSNDTVVVTNEVELNYDDNEHSHDSVPEEFRLSDDSIYSELGYGEFKLIDEIVYKQFDPNDSVTLVEVSEKSNDVFETSGNVSNFILYDSDDSNSHADCEIHEKRCTKYEQFDLETEKQDTIRRYNERINSINDENLSNADNSVTFLGDGSDKELSANGDRTSEFTDKSTDNDALIDETATNNEVIGDCADDSTKIAMLAELPNCGETCNVDSAKDLVDSDESIHYNGEHENSYESSVILDKYEGLGLKNKKYLNSNEEFVDQFKLNDTSKIVAETDAKATEDTSFSNNEEDMLLRLKTSNDPIIDFDKSDTSTTALYTEMENANREKSEESSNHDDHIFAMDDNFKSNSKSDFGDEFGIDENLYSIEPPESETYLNNQVKNLIHRKKELSFFDTGDEQNEDEAPLTEHTFDEKFDDSSINNYDHNPYVNLVVERQKNNSNKLLDASLTSAFMTQRRKSEENKTSQDGQYLDESRNISSNSADVTNGAYNPGVSSYEYDFTNKPGLSGTDQRKRLREQMMNKLGDSANTTNVFVHVNNHVEKRVESSFTKSTSKNTGKMCPHCASVIPENSIYCRFCGKQTQTIKKRCSNCNGHVSETAKFCSMCGTKL